MVHSPQEKLCTVRVQGQGIIAQLRLILIGERFFHNFSQSLELIGDMYQYTEAFCHYNIREFVQKQKNQVP